MTATTTHNNQVVDQFGAQASAYLNSGVHAKGPDLQKMSEFIGRRPEARALDMGCGGGHVTYHLAERVGSVLACDLSADMLKTVADEAARRKLTNVTVQQVAAEGLDVADHSFDIVATRYSAHHWRSVSQGIGQMARVVKPGGVGLFMDVVAPSDALLDTWLQSLELLRDPSHVRNLTVAQWCEVLSRQGFQVQQVETYALRLDFDAWVSRMKTPMVQVQAIRALQRQASSEVREAFQIAEDGSFTVRTALVAAIRI